jgi:hypothetical protein
VGHQTWAVNVLLAAEPAGIGKRASDRARLLRRALQDQVRTVINLCQERQTLADRTADLELRVAALPPNGAVELHLQLAGLARTESATARRTGWT